MGLAMDEATREMVGLDLGRRSRAGAMGLWQFLPAVYRQGAVCYTEFWEASVLPSKRDRAVGKDSGQTNYIECFNNTLRQGVGRLVPPSLSFSKKLSNHLGAIGDLIHHYHDTLTT